MKVLYVVPSAPSELAWILDLLVQRARYAGPALDELDRSLLPGLGMLQADIRQRFDGLWQDGVGGCPELLPIAHHAGALSDTDLDRLFDWLRSSRMASVPPLPLLSEAEPRRPEIRRRVGRLCEERRTRAAYLDALSEVWRRAGEAWRRDGLPVVTRACATWRERLGAGIALEDLVAPRHPLSRADEHGLDDLLRGEHSFVISPLYFCLSGGHVVDLGELVHVGVAASDLIPIRKVRDAAFVADRLRVLAEPTRVHILIQLMSNPSGVMEVARALRISQPTVSGHVKVLERAGLIQQRRRGSRAVLMASRKRVERLLEDARTTLIRWD